MRQPLANLSLTERRQIIADLRAGIIAGASRTLALFVAGDTQGADRSLNLTKMLREMIDLQRREILALEARSTLRVVVG